MAKKIENDMPTELEPTETIKSCTSELDKLLEEFRIGLVKLGLKGIDDLNNKRVQNPNEFYNSLTAMYNAVKKS